jgi:hypothetical protein
MAINDDLRGANNEAKELNKETERLINSFNSLGFAIRQAIEDAIEASQDLDTIGKKVAKTYERDIAGAIKKTTLGLDEQLDLQRKLNNGQNIAKDVAKIREKQEQAFASIQARINILRSKGIEISDDLVQSAKHQADIEREVLDSLQNQNTEMVNSMGLTGRLIEGMGGFLEKLGLSSEASSMMTEALEGARAAGGGVASVTKNFAGNMMKAIKPTDIFTFLLVKSFEALKQIDTRTADFQRNLGLTKTEAIGLNDELAATAISSNTIGVNVDTMVKTVGDLNGALGGTAIIFDTELVESATFLRERLKLSEESLANMTMQSLATGQSLESLKDTQLETLVAAEKEFGMRFNTRQILDEANKISGALRLNLEKAPGGLVKAVAQAKMLGLNMEQTAKMAGKLLDFESSIESELEAELLTGKDLNLEQARLLALKGDTAGAAAEIAKQVGSSAEFAQMNVIAQQSLAEAAGLTVDELSDALRKQEGIASEAGKSSDRTADQAESAATALSVQERLAGATEKLAGFLEFSAIAIATAVGALAGLAFGPVGAIVGAATAGLATAAFLGKFSKGDDILSEGGYGKRTLLAPEGAIKLNDKDTVIAGTDLGGGGGKTSTPTASPSIDLSPLVAKMDQMNAILSQILSKEGTVMLDSTKVGTALTVGSYKMQ